MLSSTKHMLLFGRDWEVDGYGTAIMIVHVLLTTSSKNGIMCR